MAKRFADNLIAYQKNAIEWPAMVDTLADRLHVSADSLTRLGIGYVPIVKFKNGPNFAGWWCAPERNEQGELVGLTLRGRIDDNKIMYPGSKRGLVYPWTGENGNSSYRSGEHNWVRLSEAKRDCPLCDKPDGCLLSSENPDDPQAVICIRKESSQETKLGWLHILKPEGNLTNGSPLPASEYPVIVVEGLSDAATALDLGFVAIGRPNNLSNMGMAAELLRSRNAIIVGENDDAGSRGLFSGLATFSKTCSKVVGVFPPEEYKDLRAWIAGTRINADAFLRYVDAHGVSGEPDGILSDAAPLHIADRWLADNHTQLNILVLRRYKGQWFRFSGNRYEEIDSDAILRGGLYSYLDNREYKKIAKDGSVEISVYEPVRSKVTDIVDALSKSCPISDDPPCWLDGEEGPDPKRLICFSNGWFDLDLLATGETSLVEPTPSLFSLSAMPYAFDPEATCPQWEQWLTQTLGDDPDKIALLQEWFGYCMIPDTSHEKLMLFRGRTRSGKGTALEVLRAVVGPKQVATTSFGSLCTDFGRAPLVGKLTAFMPDARLPRKADSSRALESLLSIVGQDGVNINRKNLPELPDHKLMCRFTIAVNELPELPDHSQALEPRLLVLDFRESFKGREDRTLKVRLPKEAPGVANWALAGLQRLRDRGLFTEPESSAAIIKELRRVTSPAVEFIEDCCILEKGREVTQVEIYDAWVGWSRERGFRPGARSRLVQRIIASFPEVEKFTGIIEGKKKSLFKGMDLEDWTRKSFLGRP